MGQVHGPNAALHPGLRLKYVVDPRPGAAAPLCERFGAAAATLEQALADPGIGAVLVCSSTDQHLAHALAAVDAGKAVFCEKPIDLDLQKVLQARARFDGARFLLGFRSEEHTSELPSLMRISYAVFCVEKKTYN